MSTLTDNVHSIRKIWLEAYVLAGSNVYEAAREIAELANKLDQPVFSNLNGVWVMAEPGESPGAVAKRFETEYHKDRQPA